MSDAFWRHIQLLLPKYSQSPLGRLPRADLWQVMNGAIYVLHTLRRRQCVLKQLSQRPFHSMRSDFFDSALLVWGAWICLAAR